MVSNQEDLKTPIEDKLFVQSNLILFYRKRFEISRTKSLLPQFGSSVHGESSR